MAATRKAELRLEAVARNLLDLDTRELFTR